VLQLRQLPSASVNFDSAYTNNSAQWFVLTVPVPTDADLYAVRSFTIVSGSTEIVPEQAFSVINTSYTASFVVTASLAADIQVAIS
jgi:hypothetical protein